MKAGSDFRVLRTATLRLASGRGETQPLDDWRDASAYLLLGEPGAGKTEAFKCEAKASGAVYVTARNFVTLAATAYPSGSTFFIDALDEMRAGSASFGEPLDAVRRRLDELGRPRFRLACREADWVGAVDADAMQAVSPDGELLELRLEPLTRADILAVLRQALPKPADAEGFLAESERRSLDALLVNPLLLQLMVDAVSGDHWPDTRSETYKLACETLAAEHNDAHRVAGLKKLGAAQQIQHDAALLFAVLLLSGAEALTLDSAADTGSDVDVHAVSVALALQSSDAALSSKLFVADGQRRLPRHRSIAEYLAAASIAQRVANGLPLARVLALMSGANGGIVEPLRGLHAWLAALCPVGRCALIDGDPLGVVLYGDVTHFTTFEKRQVLLALAREAGRYAHFRSGNWTDRTFGALGANDMTPVFVELLSATDRSAAHQSVLDCVLDAVRYGQQMALLLPVLKQVVCDASYGDVVRHSALQAWLVQLGPNLGPARALLDDVAAGKVSDGHDEIAGRLLYAVYPNRVAAAEVMRYFHVRRDDLFIGHYSLFWRRQLVPSTPDAVRATLADGLASLAVDKRLLRTMHDWPDIVDVVISSALAVVGDGVDTPRLQRWLRTGMDEDGFMALKGDEGEGIRGWLEAHPNAQKSLLAHAYAAAESAVTTDVFAYRQCEQLLYLARRPRDWFRWLLSVAASAKSVGLAKHVFTQAARAAIEPDADFDITMDDVAQWCGANKKRWPEAETWLEQTWSTPLDHWSGKNQRQERERQTKRLAERDKRQQQIKAFGAAVKDGTAPPGLMHQLALAYKGRFHNIRGETAESRLQDFVGDAGEDLANALSCLEASLSRTDLPSVADVLKSGLSQREPLIRPACLVAAERLTQRDPETALSWSDDLASRMVAFWLTDGTGEPPVWFKLLTHKRPALVATVMVPYAKQWTRLRPQSTATGLWSLLEKDAPTELARAVLPELLATFPARANAAQVRTLNQALLPAAARHLQADVVGALIEQRLALKSLDTPQRIAWLVAGLVNPQPARVNELLRFVGHSQARAVQLGEAFTAQTERSVFLDNLSAPALSHLVELLAPHTASAYPEGGGWVGPAEHRRNVVHGLIRRLSSLHDDDATAHLQRLRERPDFATWRVVLDAALWEHTRVQRAAQFRHASAQAVARVLAGQAPANACDLSALVVDHLREIAQRIVGDDSNAVRLFWRDGTAASAQPKIENECRDVLLLLLRDRLLLKSVQLEKEASAANDARADLRASTVVNQHRVVVPIEIKKEDHDKLWTAWRDQLDGRYVTDPAANGTGIYLVLWSGHRPRASPTGFKPRSPSELEQALIEQIPAVDRARLTVVVLDLSTGKRSG
jgi:hypothetical protein